MVLKKYFKNKFRNRLRFQFYLVICPKFRTVGICQYSY
nr:MAG TPA: hypothetical protein [Caudoviricetes sp.]